MVELGVVSFLLPRIQRDHRQENVDVFRIFSNHFLPRKR